MPVGLRADIVRPHRHDPQQTTSDEHLLIILCKQTIWGAFRVIQGPVGRANNMVPLVCYNHYYLQYLVYEQARNMRWREDYVLRKLH